MQHDWIFDVLSDLRTYAQQNALPALAAKVEDALQTAQAEIAELRSKEVLDESVPPVAGNRRPH